jgi:hypothetical protein
MKKNLRSLGITTTAGLAASSASATIIHTTLSEPLLVSAPSELYFNLEEQTAGESLSLGPGRFEFNWRYGDSSKPIISGSDSGSGIAINGGYASRFNGGEIISSSLYFVGTADIAYSGIGNFSLEPRGFLGLRFDNNGTDNFGWADIEFNSSDQLVLYSFAYDDSGSAIQAGAIPEPRTSAFLAALVAGSAAMFARRRKAVCTNG